MIKKKNGESSERLVLWAKGSFNREQEDIVQDKSPKKENKQGEVQTRHEHFKHGYFKWGQTYSKLPVRPHREKKRKVP